MAILYGIHAVEQALAAGRLLERLLVARGRGGARVQQLLNAAQAANTAVRFVQREELDQLAGTPKHQGVVAGVVLYEAVRQRLGKGVLGR